MNIFISSLVLASSLLGLTIPNTPKITDRDLRLLTGAQWSGTLTYLDYRSNKKVSIPSNLIVTESGESKLAWLFEYRYPEEPKANSRDTVRIAKDGRSINGEMVTERTELAGNTLRIVTEKKGQDDERNALFRYTYLINAKSFSIKKEVQHEGSSEFFERNEYSWTR